MRVALADDAALFREGIARLLIERDVTVTASVGDGAALTGAVADDPPDAVVLDIRMPPTHTTEGLDAALLLRQRHPDLAVLLLSQYVETTHVADLLRSGGRTGYLLKERVVDPSHLTDALERLVAGGSVVDPEVIALVLGGARQQRPLDRLTLREREVLTAMAEGRSNRAIGARFSLSAKTVETHIGRIFTKLDLPPVADDNRRVRAVLLHLQQVGPSSPRPSGEPDPATSRDAPTRRA